jgi:hypothetical protein
LGTVPVRATNTSPVLLPSWDARRHHRQGILRMRDDSEPLASLTLRVPPQVLRRIEQRAAADSEMSGYRIKPRQVARRLLEWAIEQNERAAA